MRAAGKERKDLYGPTGLTVQAVSNVMRGKSEMFCAEHVIKLARYLNVNPLWLATGEGPVWDLPPIECRELVHQLTELPTRRRRQAIQLCQQLAVLLIKADEQQLQQVIEFLKISSSTISSKHPSTASSSSLKPRPDGDAR